MPDELEFPSPHTPVVFFFKCISRMYFYLLLHLKNLPKIFQSDRKVHLPPNFCLVPDNDDPPGVVVTSDWWWTGWRAELNFVWWTLLLFTKLNEGGFEIAFFEIFIFCETLWNLWNFVKLSLKVSLKFQDSFENLKFHYYSAEAFNGKSWRAPV